MLDKVNNQRLIRRNLRFATYQGELDHQKVFIKTAAQEKYKPAVWKEAAGLESMRELDPGGSHYFVPTVVDVSDDTIITSWAEGKLMSGDLSEDTIKAHLATLLKLFTYVDSRTSGSIGITRFNQPDQENGIDKTMRQLRQLGLKRQFDGRLAERISDYAQEHVASIETRFTHGDLQPGNLLVGSDCVPTLIDCESCSWLWPRHYNIVNFAFNYFTHNQPWLSRHLASACVEYFDQLQIDPQNHLHQVNFSAAMRCMQILRETLGDHTEPGRKELPAVLSDLVTACMHNVLEGRLFWEGLI